MSHTNRSKCSMALIQQACKEKVILKPNADSFNTTNARHMNTSL